MKHSPLPWKVEERSYFDSTFPVIADSDGVVVNGAIEEGEGTALPDMRKEDADLIVRAVNTHEELVEVCEVFLESLHCYQKKRDLGEKAPVRGCECVYCAAFRRASGILARAKEAT